MNRIRDLRKERNIKQIELSKQLGISQATLSGWENEKFEPDLMSIKKMSTIFSVSIDYLLGTADNTSNVEENTDIEKNYISIPVLGHIPAGIPIEAIEDIIDYEDIPREWGKGGKEYFALEIKGNSMEPNYLNGDRVIFLKTNTAETGDDVAVMVNGDEATFKRIERIEAGIILKPLNPIYETKFFTNMQIMELPVNVIGIAKELRRNVKR